ncbi:MAG: alpha/beta hydrolase [Candidatus Aminicenantaceae bacterium]
MRVQKRLLIPLCVLVLLAACLQSPREEAGKAGGKDLAFSEDGVPIYYESQGQGDFTLVFVHGWCTDMSYWEAQIPSFRVYYQVVTLDLAGHGRSGKDRDVWSMEAFGQDVAAVVRKLDLNHVILIGHSLGGPVVLEAARLLPDRVIGLLGADTFSDIYMRPYSDEQIESVLEPFRTDFQEGMRRYVLENYFRFTSSGKLKKRIILDMAKVEADMAVGTLEQLLRYDAAETLQQLVLPIRSINADRPLVYFRVMRNNTENFTNRFLNNVGHFLMIEDPQTFNRVLSEFLGQIIQESYQ